MKTFSDTKIPGEKVVLTFDFTAALPAGVTLTGAGTPVVSVRTGNDSAPSGMLNGAAAIDATSKMVLVPVQAGIDMTDYLFTVIPPTTNPQFSPGLVGQLSVRA